ncbi:hypothetical protein [Engelhardtia mirabilis]|uniref:Uncharacterized protein n=1 Tax=Engelhardtia mirabilis TaxID=2528011 RepID=A0A518BHJ6_9BACT|nr:hypothetical protein Pla133_15220 [Planctomycetes bacterium Pla133]QDV00774.1 hypothetical protein Pla86_15210 [Planctomycetes bacterium Pla86]
MKSSSWIGAVVLLIALVLAFLFRGVGESTLPELTTLPATPGHLDVRVACTDCGWPELNAFTEQISNLLVRELRVSPADIAHGYPSMMMGGPFGKSAESSLTCPVAAVDLSLIEPALLGAAIESFSWVDDQRQVLVRLSLTDASGQSSSRDLVRSDGRVRWVDTVATP